jgi:hypothetical protein
MTSDRHEAAARASAVPATVANLGMVRAIGRHVEATSMPMSDCVKMPLLI